ncbi:Hypothetical_protein [Hexamita inflata]|uniref:Hypothetical_protein n=1 Tax=Hexamita inflata TaxID=28002 RepID=A0AA86RF26_9EUKA|nr:Hypothetical protein HINF_LOCUS59452 [Hexamita inflata]
MQLFECIGEVDFSRVNDYQYCSCSYLSQSDDEMQSILLKRQADQSRGYYIRQQIRKKVAGSIPGQCTFQLKNRGKSEKTVKNRRWSNIHRRRKNRRSKTAKPSFWDTLSRIHFNDTFSMYNTTLPHSEGVQPQKVESSLSIRSRFGYLVTYRRVVSYEYDFNQIKTWRKQLYNDSMFV